MNELIKISENRINDKQIQTVNARDLHEFLQVRTRFADWIQRRIDDFDFQENQDFITLSQNRENGGRSIEYFLSLSMAKELSMVERTEKGKQARLYFIKCEQVAKAKIIALPDFTNPAIAARAWAEQYEKAQLLETKIEADRPMVEFGKTLYRDSRSEFFVRDAAKMLGVSVRELFNFMRSKGWIFINGSAPKAHVVYKGYMTVKPHCHIDNNGIEHNTPTGFITYKGLERLHAALKRFGIIPQDHQLQLDLNIN